MSAPHVGLPEVAWLVALASLPEVGPARLAALLDGRPPRQAFDDLVEGRLELDAGFADRVRRGDPASLIRRWRAAAAATDVGALWERHRSAGIAVLGPDDRDPRAGEDAAGLLGAAIAAGRLSGRGLARVRAVARTLADLDGHPGPVLSAEHVALALAQRQPLVEPDDRAA